VSLKRPQHVEQVFNLSVQVDTLNNKVPTNHCLPPLKKRFTTECVFKENQSLKTITVLQFVSLK